MTEEQSLHDIIEYKLLVVGNSGVGKTSLLKVYQGEPPSKYILPSIGIDLFIKQEKINHKHYILKIWDTSGQEKYKAMAKSFFKNSKGFLVVFSLSELNSFMEVEKWISDIADNCSKPCWVLVGNKADIATRSVSSEEAYKLAKKYKVPYCETTIYDDKATENTKKIGDVIKQLVYLLDNNEGKAIKIERKLNLNESVFASEQNSKCVC